MAQDQKCKQVNRREWLKAACGALALAPALATANDGIREKAKKNIKLAIFARLYSAFPLEEAARRIKADGFRGVMLDFDFADVHFDPLAPDWEAAKKITGCFARHGIAIAGLTSYYNIVDPDVARREHGEKRMEAVIANWKRLGSPIIGTGSGSVNPKSEWLESPENATEKVYLQCRSSLERLARQAEKTGAIVAVEPYWHNVIDGVARAERLIHEVNSPSLRLVMDPCNYYRKEDLRQYAAHAEGHLQARGKVHDRGPWQGREGL